MFLGRRPWRVPVKGERGVSLVEAVVALALLGIISVVFLGRPYEVDREASETLGIKTDYLDLIEQAKLEFES